jgi:hypothetical protein
MYALSSFADIAQVHKEDFHQICWTVVIVSQVAP